MQKFNNGDYVHIASDLGIGMEHFTNTCDAIVIGSYDDQYGNPGDMDKMPSYTLYIKGKGKTSWYMEDQLELIEHNRLDILDEWKLDAEKEEKCKSDLDWIFDQGHNILESAHSATIGALANCFGLTNLWGDRGEGFTYYRSAMRTLEMAKPFLENNDKIGWLSFCDGLTGKNN